MILILCVLLKLFFSITESNCGVNTDNGSCHVINGYMTFFATENSDVDETMYHILKAIKSTMESGVFDQGAIHENLMKVEFLSSESFVYYEDIVISKAIQSDISGEYNDSTNLSPVGFILLLIVVILAIILLIYLFIWRREEYRDVTDVGSRRVTKKNPRDDDTCTVISEREEEKFWLSSKKHQKHSEDSLPGTVVGTYEGSESEIEDILTGMRSSRSNSNQSSSSKSSSRSDGQSETSKYKNTTAVHKCNSAMCPLCNKADGTQFVTVASLINERKQTGSVQLSTAASSGVKTTSSRTTIPRNNISRLNKKDMSHRSSSVYSKSCSSMENGSIFTPYNGVSRCSDKTLNSDTSRMTSSYESNISYDEMERNSPWASNSPSTSGIWSKRSVLSSVPSISKASSNNSEKIRSSNSTNSILRNSDRTLYSNGSNASYQNKVGRTSSYRSNTSSNERSRHPRVSFAAEDSSYDQDQKRIERNNHYKSNFLHEGKRLERDRVLSTRESHDDQSLTDRDTVYI